MKKFLSMLLAVALVLSLGIVALATEVNTNVAEVNGTPYATLQEAIDAANAGDTVMLINNVTESSVFPIEKKITLDLGGNIFTSTATNFGLWILSDVTIQNGTINAENVQAAIYVSEHLIIGPNLVINTPYAGVVVKENGNVPGKVTVPSNGSLDCPSDEVTAILADKNGCKMDISGTVKANGAGGVALQTNGTREKNVININEGANVSANAHAIYFPSDGEVNISGGTIAGGTGVEIRAGVLNITGGTITATGTFSERANGNGATITGVAVAVSQHTTDKPITVNISDGTFDGVNAVYEKDQQEHPTNEGAVTINIDGGDYQAPVKVADVDDPTAANGKVTANVTGGTFTEEKIGNYVQDTNLAVATVGGSTYAVGAASIEAAVGNDPTKEVVVTKGNAELTGLPEGTKVTNKGTGTVSANGETVPAGKTVEVPAKPVYRDTVTIEIGGEKTEEETKTETETEANPNTGAPSFIGAAVAVSVLALGGIVLSKKK